MNVKSFVNGLDPDNTVKGYYDENDQLVMVEPEGSGGGGALTLANVAIKSSTLEDGNTIEYYLPLAEEVEDEDPQCVAGKNVEIGTTVKVPLYKGSALGTVGSAGVTVTVESGDAEAGAFGSVIIHGDCTIVIDARG